MNEFSSKKKPYKYYKYYRAYVVTAWQRDKRTYRPVYSSCKETTCKVIERIDTPII